MSKLQYLIANTTKAVNSLQSLLDTYSPELTRFKAEKVSDLDNGLLQEIVFLFDSKLEKLQAATEKLADAADETCSTDQSEMTKFEEKLKAVQKVEIKAEDLRDSLAALRARSLAEKGLPQDKPPPSNESRRSSVTLPVERQPSNLPPLKLPTFSGDRWEFNRYWSIFEEVINKANIPAVIKFTHLLNSLKGEARQLLSHFQETSENYPAAIKLLQTKYSDAETTVLELNEKLLKDKAKDNSIREQRLLLERLVITTLQLERLKEPVDNRLMKDLIMEKFDKKIRREVYKKKLADPDDWTIHKMFQGLEYHITLEEDLQILMKSKDETPDKPNHPKKENKISRSSNEDRPNRFKRSCVYCKSEDHPSYECKTITSIKGRRDFLTRESKCHICLKNHDSKECRSPIKCYHCKGKHNSSICADSSSGGQSASTPSSAKYQKEGKHFQKDKGQKPKSATTNVSHSEDAEESLQYETQTTQKKTSKAFVPTIQTRAQDPVTGKWRTISMMVDTGADRSFIKKSLAKSLNLQENEGPTLRVRTFGSSNAGNPEKFTQSPIRLFSDNESIEFQLLHKEHVSGKVKKAEMSKEDLIFVNRHRLEVNVDSYEEVIEPEILIGVDQMSKIWEGNTVTLPSGLLLVNTKLGYTTMGKKSNAEIDDPDIVVINSSVQEEPEPFEFAQKRDMLVCDPSEFSGASSEEKLEKNKKILQFFKDTVEKKPEGYVVRLPLKMDKIDQLPNNFKLTLKRLEGVIRSTSPEVKQMIQDIFEDQVDKNILERVTDQTHIGDRIHYSPIQPVLTPHKATTKCRVVVDASAHYRGNESLNDAIEQGPTLLPDILDILIRFRSGETVILADVEKAFLQVHLNEADRDLTRVLWVKDINSPATPDNIEIYRFTRVLFGLNASPFLLGATIAYHLENNVNPELAKKISKNLYVDNLILTFDEDADDSFKLYQQLKAMFGDINMNLREFIGNSEEFNRRIPDADKAQSTDLKVLGVPYDPCTDQIKLECKKSNSKKHCRRSVSRTIGSDFDPNGLLTPLMLPSKLFQRELWQEQFNYGWDTPLSVDHQSRWEEIRSNADGFTKILPRKVIDKSGPNLLICFCDASQEAAAYCMYTQNQYGLNIFLGKSKVKSLKEKWTIPKLELHAIAIGTEKLNSVVQCLRDGEIDIPQIIILTDSEIALSWIKSSPGKKEVGTLITNRLASIRSTSEKLADLGIRVRFGHVRSEDNPADLGTRGISKEEFVHSFWWSGPEFCRNNPAVWDTYKTFEFDFSEEEVSRINICNVIEITPESNFINRIDTNSFPKMRRTVACLFRAVGKLSRNLPTETKRRFCEKIPELKEIPEGYPPITPTEFKAAEMRIIKDHQSGISLRKQQSWNNLNLQFDKDGIIICRGRFQHINEGHMEKFPILIEPKTRLSQMIIREAHGKWHCNEQQTMTEIRTKFWIPRLRQQVKTVLSKCVPCQRYNKPPFKYPDMSDLPSCRVRATKPFENTGLDYFGPLSIRNEDGSIGQCWGCLFTCTTTRLVHIQVVTRLDTSSFLRALQRFISLCGKPKFIVSDNAPQFILADKILQEVAEIEKKNNILEEISRFTGDAGIDWKCITPYAPWQGAVYERLMRSIKQALYRGIGRNILSLDNLQTALTEIAAVLNSRPLTYVGEQIDSGKVLRPIDFVYPSLRVTYPMETTLEMLDEFAPPNETNITKNEAIEAVQSIEKVLQNAWNTWNNTYLSELRTTHKLRMDNRKGKVGFPLPGQVVLVCDPNQPRNHWKLAQIERADVASDGILREVHLKTSSGQKIKRPVNLVVPLELDGENLSEETNPGRPNENQEENPSRSQKATNEVTHANEQSQPPSPEEKQNSNSGYNLRRQRRVNYSEEDSEDNFQVATTSSMLIKPSWSKFLLAMIVTALINSTMATTPIECTPSGIRVNIEFDNFEMCVRDYCTSRPKMTWNNQFTEVWIPPALKTIDHHATTKVLKTNAVTVYELDCPAVSTCENINCVVCFNNLFNPDCHPYWALAGFGISLYLLLMIGYCICKVKIPIGAPVSMLWKIIVTLGSLCCNIFPLQNRNHRKKINWELIVPILAISFMISPVNGCQEVNLLTQGQKICSENSPSTCKMVTKEHLTMGSTNKEACLRLQQNGQATKEVRLKFIEIEMECLKTTITYTKDIETHVWSAKRCAHTGSCGPEKCLNTTTSTKIPELGESNDHIGNTYCMEGCGGLGCSCFFPSPGCLFYRIYAKEKSNKTMEIFQCAEWREQVIIEATVTKLVGDRSQKTTRLSLPISHSAKIEDVLVNIAWTNKPISPILENWMVRNNDSQVALWQPYYLPSLQCQEKLDNDTCILNERCKCQPAEDTMICQCEDTDVEKQMNSIQKRLPIREGHWILKPDNESVIASIDNEVAIGIVLTLKDVMATSILTSSDKCSIQPSPILGCYNCASGGQAEVRCTSAKREIIGNIICNSEMFTVPCSPTGKSSNVTFFPQQANFRTTCSINCGGHHTEHFEIAGVLKFTGSVWTSAYRLIQGETSIFEEISWPDISHLVTWYLQFMKSMVVIVIIVGAVVATTGAIVMSTLLMGAKRTIKWTVIILSLPLLTCRMLCFFCASPIPAAPSEDGQTTRLSAGASAILTHAFMKNQSFRIPDMDSSSSNIETLRGLIKSSQSMTTQMENFLDQEGSKVHIEVEDTWTVNPRSTMDEFEKKIQSLKWDQEELKMELVDAEADESKAVKIYTDAMREATVKKLSTTVRQNELMNEELEKLETAMKLAQAKIRDFKTELAQKEDFLNLVQKWFQGAILEEIQTGKLPEESYVQQMERAQQGRREAPLAPLEESSMLHDRVVFPTRESTATFHIHRDSLNQRDKSQKMKSEVSLPLREPTKERVPTRDPNSRKRSSETVPTRDQNPRKRPSETVPTRDQDSMMWPSAADQPSSRTLAKVGTVVKGACCTFCKEPHFTNQCHRVVEIGQRRELLAKGRLCPRCLKKKGNEEICRCQSKPCFYCGSTEHHCAICLVPETITT